MAQSFYDDLANHYHLLMADWDRSISWQADILNTLIVDSIGGGPKRILDASCGIGTQSLGLAAKGHTIEGSDLSPGAIERAKREAEQRSLSIALKVADLRTLTDSHTGPFDVICVMDNALPHLREDADLRLVLTNVFQLLAPGGILLASIRDYDRLLEAKPQKTETRVFDDPDGRRIVFQLWDWRDDGTGYRVSQYILQEQSKTRTVDAKVFQTDYWCLTRDRFNRLSAEAGFQKTEWLECTVTGFYQPVVRAVRPPSG